MTRTTRVPRALPAAAVLAVALAMALAATLAGTATPADAAAKPGPVGAVTATGRMSGGKANVQLSWPAAKGARSYQVLWATSSAMRNPRKAGVRKRSYTVRGLALGRTWCFQVRGVNGRALGKRSSPVCRRVAAPGQAAAPWMQRQRIVGGRTELTVRWDAVAGASSYELDYAITPEPVTSYPLWENKARRTITSSGPVAVVGGLTPGVVYCFQVRAMTPSGPGQRSATHCKFTMPVSRGLPTAPTFPLDMATWNLCATACDRTHPFVDRLPKIAARIKSMSVDVMTLVESSRAATDVGRLSGHTVGCTSPGGAESVLVRTQRYSIVASSDTTGGLTGPGACWVEVEDTGGHRVVVVGLHLPPDGQGGSDRIRQTQTEKVLAWVRNARPDTPLLLSGDFNSSRSHDLDGPLVALADAGIQDSYDIAASYDSLPMFNSANGWRRTPAGSTRWGAHIDRVFSTPDIHVASWKVVEPMVGGSYTQLLSDHSPVRVSLLIPAG